MSYTWEELEILPFDKLINLFVHHSPAARNIMIAQILGPKPIYYLPEEIITQIVDLLPINVQITFGRTSKKYYSYVGKATKEYCIFHSLQPLAYHEDNFPLEIINQLSDCELEQSIKKTLFQPISHSLDILAYIYHYAHERKFWFSLDKYNSLLIESYAQVVKLLTIYSTFGKLLRVLIITWMLTDVLEHLIKTYLPQDLSREKADFLVQNIQDTNAIYPHSPAMQKLLAWRDRCCNNC